MYLILSNFSVTFTQFLYLSAFIVAVVIITELLGFLGCRLQQFKVFARPQRTIVPLVMQGHQEYQALPECRVAKESREREATEDFLVNLD
jgi:hypothetical protein